LPSSESYEKKIVPIVANVFYRAGIIERWGMGTLKILAWCREFGIL
jgi:predicted HTH transcriptional regulator